MAYHAKEICLNSLNETIIRIEIAKIQQSHYNRKVLYLKGYHLTRFASGIISDASLSEFWKEIIRIDVSQNKLTTLPDTIGQLVTLRELSVDDNKLTTLPDTIGQCAALQGLYVNNNQLTTLPDTIGQCVALLGLCVHDNQLTTLPEALRQCAALRHLGLIQNKLTALPNGLRDDIFYSKLYFKINKVQCLVSQKKAPINTEEAQEHSPMQPR